ncbi:MAG: glycosyltransferase family 2 protein [Candidatus Hermodarchaeota archaeon]
MSTLNKPLITVIMPVFNEEENISQSLSSLIRVVRQDLYKKNRWPTEVLIIDDGSTDQSINIIKNIIKDQQITRLIRHDKNKGKGSAISTALSYARGDICIIQDADLEYNPSDLSKLLKPLITGKAHVVYGSRFLSLKYYNGLWSNLLGNKVLSLAGSLLIRRHITDIMTCYKAFFRNQLKNVKAASFDVEPEISAKLLLDRNINFIELPINYNPRLEGKKIKKLDGFISLWRLITTIVSVQRETLFKK